MFERILDRPGILLSLVRAVLLGLCVYYIFSIVMMVFDPSLFNEEERSLFRYHSGEHFDKDLIYQYLNASVLPPLYEVSIRSFTYFNSNIQKYIDFYVLVCLFLTLLPVALIGVFVSGVTTGLVLTLFVLIQPMYSYQVTSGTPHSLAYPIIFWCIYFLMRKSYVCLSVLCLIASVVYLPMAVTVGLCLGSLFVVDTINNHDKFNASLVKKILIVGVAGLGSLVLVRYQLQPISGFGLPLEVFEKVELYPENGIEGRHYFSVTEPVFYTLNQGLEQFKGTYNVLIVFLLFVVYVVTSVITLVTNRNMKGWCGLVIFVIVGMGVYSIFSYYKPEVSYRYMMYPLFAVLPILYVSGIASKFREGEGALFSFRNSIVVLSLLVIPLLAFDSLNREKVGFVHQIDRSEDSLMYFMENGIHSDALIASWPYRIDTEFIPYVAGKSTLVLGKAHYPTHVSYVMELRKRTFALADAYLGDDFSGLKNMKCEFSVDYFVVDLSLLDAPDVNLKYFEPFNQYVKDLVELKQGARYAMLDIPENWIAFSHGNYRVIDMKSVVRENPC